MNDTPIQIRNPEVVKAIRALADQTQLPITEAVGEAVREALRKQDVTRDAEIQQRLAAIKDISRRIRELPIVGPAITDEDLYDADGMPR